MRLSDPTAFTSDEWFDPSGLTSLFSSRIVISDIRLQGKCLEITDIIRSIYAKAHVTDVLTWWNHKAALADAYKLKNFTDFTYRTL